MKVKRYLVKDMNEAMTKIKMELGRDAVILHTRKIRVGGIFKWFKKPVLEVVAAIDDPVLPRTVPPVPVASPTSGEMDELKHMVTELIHKVDHIEVASKEVRQPEDIYIEALVASDVQPAIAKKILEIVQRQITVNIKNQEAIFNAMKVVAREYLGECKPIESDVLTRPAVYMFLGPTGVGKTTTLAKIAAKLSLTDNKKVGLITADTYRIAAVEQLRTYSEILGIPLEVIYEPSELDDALKRFKDKDYILIDTAGRSHKSKELKMDYDELTAHIHNVETFLVLSMTTGYKDMKGIIDSYGFLKTYRLLFTKLDEAVSLGNILNFKVLTGKPLSYFATGQSVPDDIEIADRDVVIESIFDRQEISEAGYGSGAKA